MEALTALRPASLGALEFNANDDPALSWVVEVVEGWDNGQSSTLEVLQRVRAPGGWASADPQLTPKPLRIKGSLHGDTPGDRARGIRMLKKAATLGVTTLTVLEPDLGPLTMRVQRRDEVLIGESGDDWAPFDVSLVAADPRKFGAPLVGATGLPATAGGLTVPFTVPFTIDAVSVTGQVALTNLGDLPGPVTARIAGPAPQGGIITHTSDLGIRVFALDLPLAADEWVDIDMEFETVLAQGASSRSQWISSRGFSPFRPGLNVWSFSAPVASAATLTITATPAWE